MPTTAATLAATPAATPAANSAAKSAASAAAFKKKVAEEKVAGKRSATSPKSEGGHGKSAKNTALLPISVNGGEYEKKSEAWCIAAVLAHLKGLQQRAPVDRWRCNAMQHTATYCKHTANTLQTHCKHIAARCNTR